MAQMTKPYLHSKSVSNLMQFNSIFLGLSRYLYHE